MSRPERGRSAISDMNKISTSDEDDEAMGMLRMASRMALMAGLALLLLAAAAALLTETPPPSTVPDCASIADADLRLRCYDTEARRPVSPPARGAIAPKAE